MRRGNKSNKVPNVKLRPAQASSRFKVDVPESSYWVQDTQDENPESSSLALCPRPFKGVVLCATGIVDKPTLFKQALELGAMSTSAFTDRVTHLVAADHGGAKYTCALERKIPILQPSWITESYQTWLKGDDVDFQLSIERYRLPVFSGVVLSLSGINDITRRTEINKILTRQQGVYVKNLERPVKVTHLLCSGDVQTEKMRYAEKFNKRGEAKIHMIWEEWFWDSLEFGGRFDEAAYQVQHPRPERKVGEMVSSSQPPPPTTPIEPSPVEELSIPQPKPPPPKVPTNHQAPDDTDEEPASIKRVPADTLKMWETLLKTRGFEIAAGKLLRSPSKFQRSAEVPPKVVISPTRPVSPIPDDDGNGRSIIDSFRRTNSFADVQTKEKCAPRQPFRRIPTSGSVLKKGESPSSSMFPLPDIPEECSALCSSEQLFLGIKFRALGEAKCTNVRNAVEGCGGTFVSEEEAHEDVDYVVVRLVSGSKIYRDERDELQRAKYRTECWLERCIFEERICSADEHLSFTPLCIQIPVPGADLVNLNFSGLEQSEACWVRRLARALGRYHLSAYTTFKLFFYRTDPSQLTHIDPNLGINLSQNFSRRSTHLLCPSGTGVKFEKAREWGIPVVNMGWLAEVSTTGVVPAVSEHQVFSGDEANFVAPRVLLADEVGEDELPVRFPKSAKAKGKEKEVEVNHTIVDITNSQSDHMEQVVEPMKLRERHLERGKALPGQRPAEDCSPFGQPLDILSDPDRYLATPPRPPSNRSASTDHISKADSLLSSSEPPQHPTLGEIRRDMDETKIPSSKSPSPMKIPSRTSGSPVKVPNEVTKALQDSITSLLGKRPSEDATVGHQTRAGKRARPHAKTKPQSRQGSRNGGRPPRQAPTAPPVPVSYEFNHFEPDDELNLADGDGVTQEQSMRVMYEDPGQLEERNRLLGMFESPSLDGDGGRKGKGLVRRSTRIAGF